MRLNTLTLQNFRNVEYAEIPLQPSMFLLGMNGEGKSTILNAVQMALQGWCEHTDRRGAGYRDLIRTGAKQAVIELDFTSPLGESKISVTLGKAREWQIMDTETGEVLEHIATPAALWTALRIDQTHATVCMFPTQIVNAPEFAGILSSYLADALNPTLLAARIPEKFREPLTSLAQRKHVALDSVVGYESLGKLCYEQRTLINRDLKIVDAVIAETGFLRPVMDGATRLSIADMPGLDTESGILAESLRTAYQQKGRAEQAATAAPVDLPALEPLEAAFESARTAYLAAREVAGTATQIAEEYHAAQADMTAANEAQAAAMGVLVEAQSGVAATCPTCGGKLTKAKREALNAAAVEAAQLSLTAAEDWQDRALERMNAVRPKYSPAGAPGADAAVTDAINAMDAANDALRNARAQHQAAPPEYTGPSVDELAELIATGEARQAVIAQLMGALGQHKMLSEAIAQAEAHRAALEPIAFGITEFHDGAAYRALLAAAATPLVEAVNKRIAGTLEVRAEGKAFLLLYNDRPLSLASRGQRATVAYAMAETFAECGAPVLLDDTNDLDPLNRGALCMRVRQAATGTVLLAGTPNSVDPEYPAKLAGLLAPMQIVEVKGGAYHVRPATMESAA